MDYSNFQKIIPFARINVSLDPCEETLANLECRFEIRDGFLNIRSKNSAVSFSVCLTGEQNIVGQLVLALERLQFANSSSRHPVWSEHALHGFEEKASFCIEQFCESEDLFELTMFVQSNGGKQKLWLKINQTELKKVVKAL